MSATRVAVWLDSYRADLRAALQLAARDGYRGLWANATNREWDPRELTHSARRHLARHLRDLGCELHGIFLEFPGLGLAERQQADARLEHFRRALEFCADWRVRRAGVSLSGFEPAQTKGLATELLAAVADLAERFGVESAIDTGVEAASSALAPIRRLGCPLVRVAVDTARLPADSRTIEQYESWVGLVQLRDVRRVGNHHEEVRFGQGDVDFAGLLAALEGRGYDGSYVVRRDAHGAEVDAMRQGRQYIERLIGCGPLR